MKSCAEAQKTHGLTVEAVPLGSLYLTENFQYLSWPVAGESSVAAAKTWTAPLWLFSWTCNCGAVRGGAVQCTAQISTLVYNSTR